MGAVFSVPYARLETWPKNLTTVRDAGFTVLALTPDDRARTLDETAPHRMDRVALMLGAEGTGLSRRALSAADTWVRIPMSHGVDSQRGRGGGGRLLRGDGRSPTGVGAPPLPPLERRGARCLRDDVSGSAPLNGRRPEPARGSGLSAG